MKALKHLVDEQTTEMRMSNNFYNKEFAIALALFIVVMVFVIVMETPLTVGDHTKIPLEMPLPVKDDIEIPSQFDFNDTPCAENEIDHYNNYYGQDMLLHRTHFCLSKVPLFEQVFYCAGLCKNDANPSACMDACWDRAVKERYP